MASEWARKMADSVLAAALRDFGVRWVGYSHEIIAAALDEARAEGEAKATAKLHDLLSGAVSALDPEVEGELCDAIFGVLSCGIGGEDNGPCQQYEKDLIEAEKRGAERERWECWRILYSRNFPAWISTNPQYKALEWGTKAIAARGPMRGPEEE